jgi:diphthamide synthase (EF-2-diphthine--ammonia ligase)
MRKCALLFSGGKDSIIALDLAMGMEFDEIRLVFFDYSSFLSDTLPLSCVAAISDTLSMPLDVIHASESGEIVGMLSDYLLSNLSSGDAVMIGENPVTEQMSVLSELLVPMGVDLLTPRMSRTSLWVADRIMQMGMILLSVNGHSKEGSKRSRGIYLQSFTDNPLFMDAGHSVVVACSLYGESNLYKFIFSELQNT